jgi:hypothetical protein
MPRKSRKDATGALQHIIIRGIERKAIFKDTTDDQSWAVVSLRGVSSPSREKEGKKQGH